MPNDNSTNSVILVPANPNVSPMPPGVGYFPLLTYGGVAVAIILAMAIFTQTQLKSISDLVSNMFSKKRK